MSPVVLVRHGSTAWTGRRYCSRSDPPLTAGGRAEARRAAEAVANLTTAGAEIWTSLLRRTRETATIISDALHGPILVDLRLREVDFGSVEGSTFPELTVRWPDLAARLLATDGSELGPADIDWPGGDSANASRIRLRALAEELRARPDLVVVSHGGTITGLARLLGREDATATFLSPGGVLAFDVSPVEAPAGSVQPAETGLSEDPALARPQLRPVP